MHASHTPKDHPPKDHSAVRWHTLEIEAVFGILQSRPEGLSENEVKQRREAMEHPVSATRSFSVAALLLAQFRNGFVLILLAATGLSIYQGYILEPVVVAVLALFSIGLGFMQEYRAEQVMASLDALTLPRATVRRNGQLKTIPADQVVAGDIVQLDTGDLIPADLRWIETVQLEVNEASLTGETLASTKTASSLPDEAQIASISDRHNLGFAGTLIVRGRGTGVVFSTGMRTEPGRRAGLLRDNQARQSLLRENLAPVDNLLKVVGLAAMGVIIGSGILRGQPLHDLLLPAIAVAVAMMPVALPITAMIFQVLGARRMMGFHVFIRRLMAVETLGGASVICVDKTGTLTRDEMTARKIWAAGEVVSVSGVGYDPVGRLLRQGQAIAPASPVTELLRAALLCNDAELERIRSNQWRIKGDAMEGALVVAAIKAGLVPGKLRADWPRHGEIPFISETRRMTTLHQGPEGQTLVCAKGAVETLLTACSGWQGPQGEATLDEEAKRIILTAAEAMAADGLRVLAIAHRPQGSLDSGEQDLCFLGLIGMMNPLCLESADAVARCAGAGIKVVMVTGDHPATARAVAREAGILRKGILITGDELAALDDENFGSAVDHIEVYARILPEQKLRIVEMLQSQGKVVVMTGRGVNDAPALKQADMGVAMGGSGAAREAADLLVTDGHFAAIVAAIEEGRRTFDNIGKYLTYLLSSNIGGAGLMVGAASLGLPLPLSAAQIVYVSLATSRLQALVLAADPIEVTLMQKGPRKPGQGPIAPNLVRLLLTGGLWSVLISLGIFTWTLRDGRPLVDAMTLTFVTITLIPFFSLYSFRSHQHRVSKHLFAHRGLNRVILFEWLLLVGIVEIPALQPLFGVVSPGGGDWWIAIVAAGTVVPVLEWAKRVMQTG